MKGHTFFDYEIRPDAEAPGSFFYHAHVGLQALTAFGPLIVDDCLAPPYQYDEERVLVFSDYFAATDEVLESGLESVPFKWTGETAGVLLNGQGVGVNQTAKPGPPARQADDANTICTLPVIDVDPGKTYRFRFIGGTGLSLLTMALEDHGNLTIIQVDGGDYLQPASTDHVQLGSGQRFDVLFKAKSAEELQATDKATFYLQFETRDRPKTLVSYGVLRYKAHLPVPTGPQQPIFTLPTAMGGWMEYTFRALRPQDNVAPTATEVTRRVVLDMVQKVNETTGRVVWEMAHLSWAEDMYANRVPALVDIYLRGDAAVPDYDVALKNYGWDPSTLSYPARVGEVLEIVLQNTGSEANLGEVDSHSFHAHGQHVFDLGQGPGLYDADANEAKMKATGYLPIMRDTTVLYRDAAKMQTAGQPAGWRAWRIRVDDPGVWLIHCHTLAHMMMGTFVSSRPTRSVFPKKKLEEELTGTPTCRHAICLGGRFRFRDHVHSFGRGVGLFDLWRECARQRHQ